MRLFVWLGALTIFNAAPAYACEPAHLNFGGTAFALTPLQIEGDKIFFFRGTGQETEVTYSPSRHTWCYTDAKPTAERPAAGCLSRKVIGGKRVFLINGKPAKIFTLRDSKNHSVATFKVINNLFTANFLDSDGKPLGKRLVFKSVTQDYSEQLEVRGWNCPNPKFLSCVGAEVTSVLNFEGDAATVPRLQSADLSKSLGHYRLSCQGLIEHEQQPVLK